MKQIGFLGRNDSTINVSCGITLIDASDLAKNFYIRHVVGVRSSNDIKLFHFLNELFTITLNELIFIAISKNLVLVVKDDDGVVLNIYNSDSMPLITEDDELFITTEDEQIFGV